MINSALLKLRAKEKGVKQRDIAQAIGVKQPTACQKINNRRPMYLHEAEIIAGLLDIPNEVFSDYFFYTPVA